MSQGIRGGSSRWLLVAAAGVALVGAGDLRAANLDKALLDNSPRILEYLTREGYKNVGVLPFKVKKGAREATFTGGPLASTLPGRLENALILCQGSNELRAIGILRDAAGVASTQKVGTWTRNNISYRALFNTQYPLAWGNRKVRPDAFLTGVVNNTGDRATTTVEIQLLDRESRNGGAIQLKDVVRFSVKTDRALLRDLGYSYALARSALKTGVTAQKRDVLAVQQVERDDEEGPQQGKGKQGSDEGEKGRPGKGKQGTQEEEKGRPGKGKGDTQTQQGGTPTPDNLAGMAFEIRYDGEKQTIRPLSGTQQGARGREWQVDPVKPGAKVSMVLTRLLEEDKRLGVVLKVNGKSTWRMEDEESISCKKWLYDLPMRGKPDVFEGFYMDTGGKNMLRFKVLTAEESAAKASELGDKAGWIDVDVYASGDGTSTQEADGEEVRVTTKGMARSQPHRGTLQQLQTQLARANNIRVKPSKWAKARGLILNEAEPTEEVKINTKSLPNPVHLGGISIKYWDRTADSGRRIQD